MSDAMLRDGRAGRGLRWLLVAFLALALLSGGGADWHVALPVLLAILCLLGPSRESPEPILASRSVPSPRSRSPPLY